MLQMFFQYLIISKLIKFCPFHMLTNFHFVLANETPTYLFNTFLFISEINARNTRRIAKL